jgi:hypothetical protein
MFLDLCAEVGTWCFYYWSTLYLGFVACEFWFMYWVTSKPSSLKVEIYYLFFVILVG